MEVKELINKLSKLNPEAKVFIYNDNEGIFMCIEKNEDNKDIYEDDEGDIIININH